MNIFVLDENPITAAVMMCDKHIPKMVVESAQMLASAVRRWGGTDEQFIEYGILTKAGKPYRGGYANHPCTVWAGDSYGNFAWLVDHAVALLAEYSCRFGKEHACHMPILKLHQLGWSMVNEPRPRMSMAQTPFALAMPDEYRDDNAVKAYRAYYHSKAFAKWEKGTPAPYWWQGVIEV